MAVRPTITANTIDCQISIEIDPSANIKEECPGEIRGIFI